VVPYAPTLGFKGCAYTGITSAIDNLHIMPDEIVSLVDVNDRVIGQAPRARVRNEGLIHRVTYIFVFNSKGQLLLQKRTPLKDLFPGSYDAAAGGVLLAGETYERSAGRELHEELGIRVPMQAHFKHYFDDGFNRYWGRVFSCQHEGPFELQPSEVQCVEFVDMERVVSGEFSPLTPDTHEVLLRWLDQ
jgi:isopentenyldiphosphate isomerase